MFLRYLLSSEKINLLHVVKKWKIKRKNAYSDCKDDISKLMYWALAFWYISFGTYKIFQAWTVYAQMLLHWLNAVHQCIAIARGKQHWVIVHGKTKRQKVVYCLIAPHARNVSNPNNLRSPASNGFPRAHGGNEGHSLLIVWITAQRYLRKQQPMNNWFDLKYSLWTGQAWV